MLYQIIVSNTTMPHKLPFSVVVRQYMLQIVTTGCLLFALIILHFYRSRRKLSQYAFTDSLTKGLNWNKFELLALEKLENTAKNWAIVVLDINQFKLFNEVYGFARGDEVLKKFIKRFFICCIKRN